MEADFSGYATKNGLKCSDGRTIMPDAFKHNDKLKVPLVWQHQHGNVENVLGHAILENRQDGVYAYGFFNETSAGATAKSMVQHGDVNALSIYANNLQQRGDNVMHGDIREVSLVLSGANPGALIDNVNLAHGDSYETLDDEAVIYTGLSLSHGETQGSHETLDVDNEEGATMAPAVTHADNAEETVQDVFDTLSDKQKKVVHYLIGEAIDAAEDADDEDDDDTDDSKSSAKHSQDASSNTELQHKEGTDMGRNVFESANTNTGGKQNHLSHAQIQTIVRDGIKGGSFKESFLEHANTYGITDIELLFPDAKALATNPELLARQADWVPKVLNAVKSAPFAKIKSLVADLTAAEARAKGYVKGTRKTEEVIKLLRRTTGPTTVYKKQKLDRDDIIDITDLDIIAWLKWEIRFMLNEEIARAILVGDGRSALSEDKIKDPEGAFDGTGIRSILKDDDLYAHQVELAANVNNELLIDEVTRARTAYRGSGNPSMYTTDKVLTDLLLLKDKMGRRLYETEAALAAALRVKEIIAVEVLEETPTVLAIIVNLVDYTVGSNRGGEISFFEDFDIDFNQNKYLMETRVSGALTKPKSALVITRQQGTLATPVSPNFNGATNTITIPSTTGVDYTIDGEIVTGSVVIEADTEVVAEPKPTYYLAGATTRSWSFTFTGA